MSKSTLKNSSLRNTYVATKCAFSFKHSFNFLSNASLPKKQTYNFNWTTPDLNLHLYLIAIKYKIWVIVIVIVFLVWKLYVFVFVIKYFNVFKYLQLLQILLLQ